MNPPDKQSILSEEASLNEQQSQSIKHSLDIQEAIKDAIAKINNQGLYQKIIAGVLTIEFVVAAYFLTSSSYLFMNPSFSCGGKDTPQDEACPKLSECTLKNDYTITAYLQIYCGNRTDQRNLIQSMLGLGSIFGVIVVNFMSDYKGRKYSILLSMALQLISVAMLLVGVYTNSTGLLAASQFIASFASSSYWTVFYVMVDKLFSKKMAEKSILIANLLFQGGYVSMIIFSNWLNWKYFVYITLLAPAVILTILFIILLVQDPIFLFTKKKYTECFQSLRFMARLNKTQHLWEDAEKIVEELKAKEVTGHHGKGTFFSQFAYLKEFKKAEILKPTILFGGQFLAAFTTSFTLFFATNHIGFSYGINFVVFGLAQASLMFPMLFLSRIIPRKIGCILLTFGMITCSACFIFNISKIGQTALAGGTMLFQGTLYVMLVIFVVETFPQHIQSTAYGAILTLGQVGKLFAPFIVRLADSLHVSPMLFSAAVSLLFGFFLLFPLKETLKK